MDVKYPVMGRQPRYRELCSQCFDGHGYEILLMDVRNGPWGILSYLCIMYMNTYGYKINASFFYEHTIGEDLVYNDVIAVVFVVQDDGLEPWGLHTHHLAYSSIKLLKWWWLATFRECMFYTQNKI